MNYVTDKTNRSYFMGVAMTAVFIYHLFTFGTPYYDKLVPFGRFFMNGFYGVDVFLFLSAYGLCFSYKNNSLKHYYFNRFKKIFPLYWIFLIVVLCFFSNDLSVFDKIKAGVLQTTGLQIFNFFKVNIEWYIPTLIFMYICFPMLFKLTNHFCSSRKKVLIFIFIVMFLALFLHPVVASSMRFVIMLSGIMAFIYAERKDSKGLLAIYTVMGITSFLYEQQYFIIPLVLLAIAKSNVYLPFFKIFSFIGKYTLEIYLAQVVTTKYMLGKGFFNQNEFLTVLMVTVLTIVISFIFHWIQKPFGLLYSRMENR